MPKRKDRRKEYKSFISERKEVISLSGKTLFDIKIEEDIIVTNIKYHLFTPSIDKNDVLFGIEHYMGKRRLSHINEDWVLPNALKFLEDDLFQSMLDNNGTLTFEALIFLSGFTFIENDIDENKFNRPKIYTISNKTINAGTSLKEDITFTFLEDMLVEKLSVVGDIDDDLLVNIKMTSRGSIGFWRRLIPSTLVGQLYPEGHKKGDEYYSPFLFKKGEELQVQWSNKTGSNCHPQLAVVGREKDTFNVG